MSNVQKHDQIREFNYYPPAEEIVIERLESLGFILEEKKVSFGESKVKSTVDFVFRRGKKKYAIEVKHSRRIQLVFMHLLPRAILLLQAAKRVGGFIPIVAVVVETLDQKDIPRMAGFIQNFAPELGWLLLDKYGKAVFKDLRKSEYKILPQLTRRPLMPGSPPELESRAPGYDHKQLSFSNLDQWLTKVFLFGRPGIAKDYWGGPQGIIENAFQLSKLAGVSPPIANAWVNGMESSGYLKKIGRKRLILLRPNALIEEWRGKYRFGDNRILPYQPMYPASDPDEYFNEILEKIRSFNQDIPLAVSGHQACRLFGIKHSSAKSIHIYYWGNVGFVANALGLVPAERDDRANLFLVEPKYPKSVLGGKVVRRGIPICDLLQCYLDLFNLPDRGREQANFIHENILLDIFEKGRSN